MSSLPHVALSAWFLCFNATVLVLPVSKKMNEETFEAEVAAIRAKYEALRNDPNTPQSLTSQGMSGSALDYQEADELGDLICGTKGHGFGTERKNTLFCSRCGNRRCTICNTDFGRIWAPYWEHMRSHDPNWSPRE